MRSSCSCVTREVKFRTTNASSTRRTTVRLATHRLLRHPALGRHLPWLHLPHVHRVPRRGRVAALAHVTRRHRQLVAVGVERERGDRRGVFGVLIQPLLVRAVPHVDDTVAAARRERSPRVKRHRVHRMDRLDPGVSDPVALKRVLLLLHVRRRVEVLPRHPALHGREHEPGAVGEPPHAPGLVTHRGLPRLLGRSGHGQAHRRVHVHRPAGHGDHEPPRGAPRARQGHGVDLTRELDVRDASPFLGEASIPALEPPVPTPGQDQARLVIPLHALHRRAVRSHDVVGARREVVPHHALAEPPADDRGVPTRGEARVEYGPGRGEVLPEG
mmetsp:Transcript_2045/g.8202  ORF Transcript_2045/g.8202 Transcript_2045/m.8202 type:complete len:329 (-) Transcript_2045:161-1147(-)